MPGPRHDICVLHLVRESHGVEPFERFLASYRRCPAGERHDFVVAFKGFRDNQAGAAYQSLLADLDCQSLYLPDEGFDIGSYVAAARALPYRYFCFLNSYSVLLAPGWLAKLSEHARRESVGAVSATGSYESSYSAARHSGAGPFAPMEQGPIGLLRCLRRRLAQVYFHQRRLKALRRDYPPFPNPHIRTNAFMLRRDRLLSLTFDRIETREDALRFESGRRGLTRQLLARNLETLVVGSDGRGYRMGEWYGSRTYRSGGQSNLLVADRRTQHYAEADVPLKRLLETYAWGRPVSTECRNGVAGDRAALGSFPPKGAVFSL